MGLFTFIENYSAKINSFIVAPLLLAASEGLTTNKWLDNNIIILLLAVFIIIENVLALLSKFSGSGNHKVKWLSVFKNFLFILVIGGILVAQHFLPSLAVNYKFISVGIVLTELITGAFDKKIKKITNENENELDIEIENVADADIVLTANKKYKKKNKKGKNKKCESSSSCLHTSDAKKFCYNFNLCKN